MSYIKLDRKLLDWEWFTKPAVLQVWIYLLLNANYVENEWQGVTVGEGELITSIAKIMRETGLTFQQTRTALSKLDATNEITINTTNKYSHIRINKWSEYQADNKQTTSDLTINQQHLKNIRNKEIKNIKERNIKERKIPPTLDEVESYCRERNKGVDHQRFYDYYTANGWKVGKNPMKDWKAAVRTWERNKPQEETLPTYDSSKNEKMSYEDADELLKLMGKR